MTTTTEALRAAIRAAKLALFVIRKQGVMPNSSWESGFNSDLALAEAALEAALSTAPSGDGVTEAATALVNFAWSAVVTDSTESAEYLNELVDNLRSALSQRGTE